MTYLSQNIFIWIWIHFTLEYVAEVYFQNEKWEEIFSWAFSETETKHFTYCSIAVISKYCLKILLSKGSIKCVN